jgi:hypothetical protein
MYDNLVMLKPMMDWKLVATMLCLGDVDREIPAFERN